MITIEKLVKIYPDGTQAVKDLSFTVEKGEVCVLLGPSGCGKTTTMKMINRLIPISGGKIYINGQDNTGINADQLRRDIGYAIQQIGLFPHMTVGGNIQVVPVLKGWPEAKRRARARELLDLVGLDPDTYYNRYPAELSGGQRQRVGVARCLGADPEILLMDEPFGAIDPITRSRLQDEFLKIQEEIRKTIVFVTHDLGEALKMGDKIALMRAGELVQFDTPSNLLYQPKNEFVRKFVGADRALQGLRLLKLREVMETDPPTTDLDIPVAQAMERMKQNKTTWLMAVDGTGKFVGWIDRAELRDHPGDKTLHEVLLEPTVTALPETFLNEALSLMLGSTIGNLAVVDRRGYLQGVLTFNKIRDVITESNRGEDS